jgi:presenilin-like A22 family membrane protease
MTLENLDSVVVYDKLYYNFFIMIKIFYILVQRISIILKKKNKKLKKIDKFIYEAFRS